MEEMRGRLIRRQIFMADDETAADLFACCQTLAMLVEDEPMYGSAHRENASNRQIFTGILGVLRLGHAASLRMTELFSLTTSAGGKYFIAAGQAALRCLVAAAPISCAAPCAMTAVWQF